ncbi:hypothetical protein C8R46DRAFT_1213977 [Mycena filopes]|nr:hypothetical protein C8R46DRAFT_1213977 [Mycena filopes]
MPGESTAAHPLDVDPPVPVQMCPSIAPPSKLHSFSRDVGFDRSLYNLIHAHGLGRDVGGERASAVVLVPEPVNRQADSDRLLLVHSLLLPTHAPDTPWPVPSLVDLNSWPPTHPSLALALLISGNSRLTDFEPLTGIHEAIAPRQGRLHRRLEGVEYPCGFLFVGKLVLFPTLITVSSFLFVPVQPLHRDKEPFDDDWNEFNDLGYSANKFRPSTPHPTRALGRIFVRFPPLHRDMDAFNDDWNDFNDLHKRISPYRPPLLLGLDEHKASESTLLLTSNLTPCHRRTQSAQRRLTGMTSYSHLLNLEDLDISKNEVDSLRQLASLPHLRELRANGNALTSTEGLEWLDGLVKLPLEGNAIEGELDPARFLWTRMEVLSARGNRLRVCGLVLIEDARQKGGRGQDESVERWELADTSDIFHLNEAYDVFIGGLQEGDMELTSVSTPDIEQGCEDPLIRGDVIAIPFCLTDLLPTYVEERDHSSLDHPQRDLDALHPIHFPSYSIIPDPSLRLKLPRSEALRFIAGQPAHKQIQYHISNQDYYARDGVPGHTYCCGVLPTPMYRELRAGVLSTTDFEANLLVKYGVTLNIAARQLDYRKCDGLDTTMWFWSLPTMQRYRLERLIHLDLLCNGPRDARTCSGCHTVHREFWPLSVAGSFLRLRGCALDLQAAIGEHNMEVEPLSDFSFAFPHANFLNGQLISV